VNENYFLILNSFDGKKLIRKFYLINLLIIFSTSLSFKGYLCYFDDQ